MKRSITYTVSLHERGRDSCFMRWCSKIVLCFRSRKNCSFLLQFQAPLARKFTNIFNFLRNFLDATFCRRNGLKWKIVKAQVCTAMLVGFRRHLSPGGGGVLPRISDRGVPRRFVNPNPIYGLRKRKLIPFLRPKAEKWHPIQGKNKIINGMKRKTLFLLCNIVCIASSIKY